MDDLAAVIHFPACGVTAGVMVPGQHYTRDDFKVGRPTEPEYRDSHWVATEVRTTLTWGASGH